ncbi:MAG: SDR family NAD(P)-dependent oxidoreductase [Chthoniobacterales bacterium]
MAVVKRIALITGGGNGLGRAIAHALARQDVSIVLADLKEDDAWKVLDEIGQADTGLALGGDISNPETSESWVNASVKAFGRLDILVNCAATYLVDRFMEISPERWDKVFAVNTKGAFFCLQAAARAMIPNGFGRIVQVSTPASRLGFPDFASYGASKAAMDSVVRSAALTLAPHGITVNQIVPGRMTGGMIAGLEQELSKLSGKSEAELEEGRTKALPMKRRVTPEEVAEAVLWLTSDAAAYVTCERFNFTGGMELT